MTTEAILEPIFRKPYLLGGKATATLVSGATGARFTYRICGKDVGSEDQPRTIFFVSVLTGSDNQEDYSYLGTIFEGGSGKPDRFVHGKKSRISADAPSALAFAWLWRNLDSDKAELWHAGACSRCGRQLTDPESIAAGLGPICITR